MVKILSLSLFYIKENILDIVLGVVRDVKTGRFVRSDDAGKYILGFERTPLLEKTYNIWRCMVNRGKHKNFIKGSHSEEVYKDVSICEEWCGVDGFRNFISDMGCCPSPEHSINRINGHKVYEKGFVEWSTPSEQKYDTKRQSNNTTGVSGISKRSRKDSIYWCVALMTKKGKQTKMIKNDFVKAVETRVGFEFDQFGFSKTLLDLEKNGLNVKALENGLSEDCFNTIKGKFNGK